MTSRWNQHLSPQWPSFKLVDHAYHIHQPVSGRLCTDPYGGLQLVLIQDAAGENHITLDHTMAQCLLHELHMLLK